MIFGFNTDVKYGDTVYHVQSEAKQGEQLLQTQVFVRGRCIGKRAISYADRVAAPDFSDAYTEQMLREQHRGLLDSIREGKLDDLLDKQEPPETLAGIRELDLHWVNSGSVHAAGDVVLRLRVTEGGTAVASARLTSRLTHPQRGSLYSQAVTDASGMVELKITLEEPELPEASILVQANYESRTVTRKFRLRRIEA